MAGLTALKTLPGPAPAAFVAKLVGGMDLSGLEAGFAALPCSQEEPAEPDPQAAAVLGQ